MSTLIRVDRAKLERRRDELLDHARLSRDDLEDRAERYVLTPDEADVLEEVREIEFLLGDR
jgi:hypothetical protein